MPGSHRRLRAHDAAARDRLIEVAASHGGVFSPADLPAAGVDDATFRRLRRGGMVRRLQRGVYADAAVIDAAMRDEVDWHLLRGAAAIHPLRREAWLTSTTALHAYGVAVPYSEYGTIRIWRPADVDRRGAQQCPASGSLSVELGKHSRRGVPLVPPAVAAVHAACHLPQRWGLVACDGVLEAGLASRADLARARRQLESFAGIGRANISVRLARRGAESALESISRWACHVAGLPEPELQVAFYDALGFIGRVDMFFRGLGVICEADGLGKYGGDPDALVREKLREDRLRALGFEIVRWTWDQMYRHPEGVMARIHAAAVRYAARAA